jgi:hypothetical protein
VVAVTTREKPGTSATMRSQSVVFPEPAGPARTSRTAADSPSGEVRGAKDEETEGMGLEAELEFTANPIANSEQT